MGHAGSSSVRGLDCSRLASGGRRVEDAGEGAEIGAGSIDDGALRGSPASGQYGLCLVVRLGSGRTHEEVDPVLSRLRSQRRRTASERSWSSDVSLDLILVAARFQSRPSSPLDPSVQREGGTTRTRASSSSTRRLLTLTTSSTTGLRMPLISTTAGISLRPVRRVDGERTDDQRTRTLAAMMLSPYQTKTAALQAKGRTWNGCFSRFDDGSAQTGHLTVCAQGGGGRRAIGGRLIDWSSD